MDQQLRLSQFVAIVKNGIEMIFDDHQFLIVAEVSKIREWHSRYYIELIEYEGNKVVATSHALITNPNVLFAPLRERKLKLEELKGQQILMTCKVNFHKDYGYQLYVLAISAEYTLGSIKKKELSIKEELKSLGIYGLNKQKELGEPPLRIAILSSPSSEGFKDFIKVLDESDYKYSYDLFETAIHGNNANEEIYKTLQKIYAIMKDAASSELPALSPGLKLTSDFIYDNKHETRNTKPEAGTVYDLVVIVRGGGGTSGILWHNDLGIAKGICYMQVPVMIAVGHTSDEHLLDEIARFSAKTPTDAAYMIVNAYDKLSDDLQNMRQEIQNEVAAKLEEQKDEIVALKEEVDTLIQQRLELYAYNIQSRFDVIHSTKPEKMLQSGYALLSSLDGNLLTRHEVDELKKGDKFTVTVYDRQFIVNISDIEV